MATSVILPPAHADSLTGLADSAELRRWLERNGQAATVWLLIVNISRFDAINDALGANAADAVLRAIGHRLEPLVAESGLHCITARMAGAEFGVALAGDILPDRLLLLAEAIVERVGQPVAADGKAVRLGCHIGIAVAEAGANDRGSIVRRAAKAVADARKEDTGPIRLVTAGDTKVAGRISALQADLRNALAKGEIEILFQPQFAIASGRIEGVEALARWQHPKYGLIGAKTLFTVAEQSDYLVELSAHIQRRALELAAAWPTSLSRLRLSVNVTAHDIKHPGFAERFLALVESCGFARARLTVEVTETGLMEDLDASAKVLAKFRSAGCRVAIDDFGTGYSSLAYLKALPADYLKLDHGLSAEITGTERDSVVVRGAIDMAHSLGLSVIAEGVESEGQLGLLARAGCSHFQGFLRAGPLNGAALQKLVEAEA
jgi:diguanylate cyclase (GGDEF)-like protein